MHEDSFILNPLGIPPIQIGRERPWILTLRLELVCFQMRNFKTRRVRARGGDESAQVVAG
jgi:hypothetical protein